MPYLKPALLLPTDTRNSAAARVVVLSIISVAVIILVALGIPVGFALSGIIGHISRIGGFQIWLCQPYVEFIHTLLLDPQNQDDPCPFFFLVKMDSINIRSTFNLVYNNSRKLYFLNTTCTIVPRFNTCSRKEKYWHKKEFSKNKLKVLLQNIYFCVGGFSVKNISLSCFC